MRIPACNADAGGLQEVRVRDRHEKKMPTSSALLLARWGGLPKMHALPSMPPNVPVKIQWPEGKRFAFTIFDDTDHATLENNQAIYGLLKDLGFRTTKTAWMFDGQNPPVIPGVTCCDPVYRQWLQQLQGDGFEIAWHNATWETSDRETTLRGLAEFESTFGHPPLTMANHASNQEGIYWGASRFEGLLAHLYRRQQKDAPFAGHEAGSPLFWGDACQQQIRYVRNFTYREINTLKACPFMPYHDADKPYARAWFAATEGPDCASFNAMLSEANQDRLEEEGGLCILYTHFGKYFHSSGVLNPRFVSLMERLSAKNGWFVPTATLLAHLEKARGLHEITPGERSGLQNRWALEQVRRLIKR